MSKSSWEKEKQIPSNKNSLCMALKIRKDRHVWKIANNPVYWIVELRLEKWPIVILCKILCSNIRLELMQMKRF